MKLFPLLFVLLLTTITSAFGLTELWVKTVTPVTELRGYSVGSDGAFAYFDGARDTPNKLYWFNRAGELIREIPILQHRFYGIIHISHDEVVLMGDNRRMLLYQLVDGTLHITDTLTTVTYITSTKAFDYPYQIRFADLGGGRVEFRLVDLTSERAPTIVGDITISIRNENLRVRWKSLVGAKYKVQTSPNMTNWTDYTEVVDGTGSTLIVLVPIDTRDEGEGLFIRVVKL